MLEISNLLTGPFSTNSYVLWNKETRECVLFDPCADVAFITNHIKNDMELTVKALMLTHGHFDHNFAVGAFRSRLGVPVYMNRKDVELVPIYKEQAICYGFREDEFEDMEEWEYSFLKDGDTVDILGESISISEAPGHTRGSLLYHTSAGVICGDVIFNGSIGRTDLHGGSMSTLLRSIKEKVMVLPDKTLLYPGHGNKTTVGFEKANNPFLRGL